MKITRTSMYSNITRTLDLGIQRIVIHHVGNGWPNFVGRVTKHNSFRYLINKPDDRDHRR
jgi:hypothetical protein